MGNNQSADNCDVYSYHEDVLKQGAEVASNSSDESDDEMQEGFLREGPSASNLNDPNESEQLCPNTAMVNGRDEPSDLETSTSVSNERQTSQEIDENLSEDAQESIPQSKSGLDNKDDDDDDMETSSYGTPPTSRESTPSRRSTRLLENNSSSSTNKNSKARLSMRDSDDSQDNISSNGICLKTSSAPSTSTDDTTSSSKQHTGLSNISFKRKSSELGEPLASEHNKPNLRSSGGPDRPFIKAARNVRLLRKNAVHLQKVITRHSSTSSEHHESQVILPNGEEMSQKANDLSSCSSETPKPILLEDSIGINNNKATTISSTFISCKDDENVIQEQVHPKVSLPSSKSDVLVTEETTNDTTQEQVQPNVSLPSSDSNVLVTEDTTNDTTQEQVQRSKSLAPHHPSDSDVLITEESTEDTNGQQDVSLSINSKITEESTSIALPTIQVHALEVNMEDKPMSTSAKEIIGDTRYNDSVCKSNKEPDSSLSNSNDKFSGEENMLEASTSSQQLCQTTVQQITLPQSTQPTAHIHAASSMHTPLTCPIALHPNTYFTTSPSTSAVSNPKPNLLYPTTSVSITGHCIFPLDTNFNMSVTLGDITKQHTEAIVNSTDVQLLHVGALSRSIAAAADQQMVYECQRYLQNHGGPLNVMEVMNTSAGGRLSAQIEHILHVVSPYGSYDLGTDKATMHKLINTFLQCLKHADGKLHCSSIAFPLLGSGSFSSDTCINAFYNAVLIFLSDKRPQSQLNDVRLVINDDEIHSFAVDYYSSCFQNILTEGIDESVAEALNNFYGNHTWETRQAMINSCSSSLIQDTSNTSNSNNDTTQNLVRGPAIKRPRL